MYDWLTNCVGFSHPSRDILGKGLRSRRVGSRTPSEIFQFPAASTEKQGNMETLELRSDVKKAPKLRQKRCSKKRISRFL